MKNWYIITSVLFFPFFFFFTWHSTLVFTRVESAHNRFPRNRLMIDWKSIKYGTVSDLVLGRSGIQFHVMSFWKTVWNLIIGEDVSRLEWDLVRKAIDWCMHYISVESVSCKMPWAHSQEAEGYHRLWYLWHLVWSNLIFITILQT